VRSKRVYYIEYRDNSLPEYNSCRMAELTIAAITFAGFALDSVNRIRSLVETYRNVGGYIEDIYKELESFSSSLNASKNWMEDNLNSFREDQKEKLNFHFEQLRKGISDCEMKFSEIKLANVREENQKKISTLRKVLFAVKNRDAINQLMESLRKWVRITEIYFSSLERCKVSKSLKAIPKINQAVEGCLQALEHAQHGASAESIESLSHDRLMELNRALVEYEREAPENIRGNRNIIGGIYDHGIGVAGDHTIIYR